MWIIKCEMLGYDLQISTVTQRVVAGHCEHRNAYLVVQRGHFFPSCTINHAVKQSVEALQCGTGRKVAVWLPDDVTGNFPYHKTSGRNMSLSSAQILTEKNSRNISFAW
jgi:hypothetical protein